MRLVAIVLLAMLSGCSHTFYKNTDGVNNSIAISLPDEDVVKLQIIEYISGNRTTVKEPSTINHKYESFATNQYLWGMIEINEHRRNEITVTPTNRIEQTK